MSKKSRRKFTAEFKAKVCIEAIKERQTIESLSKKYDLHPNQINETLPILRTEKMPLLV